MQSAGSVVGGCGHWSLGGGRRSSWVVGRRLGWWDGGIGGLEGGEGVEHTLGAGGGEEGREGWDGTEVGWKGREGGGFDDR